MGWPSGQSYNTKKPGKEKIVETQPGEEKGVREKVKPAPGKEKTGKVKVKPSLEKRKAVGVAISQRGLRFAGAVRHAHTARFDKKAGREENNMEMGTAQIQHVMTDVEKVEAAGHATDMISAMQSLEALCESLYGNEECANAALPVIIEVARSTAERADMIRRLIVG